MFELSPIDTRDSIINQKYNEKHPNISTYYANVNLTLGKNHWSYQHFNPSFGLIEHYSLIQLIGKGRDSEVYYGLKDKDKNVAIKILRHNNFNRIRRELKIISLLNKCPNIIHILDIVYHPEEQIVAIIMDYSDNYPIQYLLPKFNLTSIKFYIYRVAECLEYLHSHGIMHRDIKPDNILCSSPEKEIYITDFGFAEFYHPLRKYNINVCTLNYTPPEILIGYPYYDFSLDIWSLGVIFFEFLIGSFHVFSGNNTSEVFESIVDLMGGKSIIQFCSKYHIKIHPKMINKLETKPGKPIESLIPEKRKEFLDPYAIDLLKRCLKIDHKLRLSAKIIMQHPFFEEVRLYDQNSSSK